MSVAVLKQLKNLSSSIVGKPPYYCGTLSLSPEDFLLFYGKDSERGG